MSNIGGDTWQYNLWTPSSTGNYSYIVWMEDNFNNWNSTSDSINVIDTTPPSFSSLFESSDPIELGDPLFITINVADIADIKRVLIEYEATNHSMSSVGGDLWRYDSWMPNSAGNHSYTIYMEDYNENWNSISGSIMFQDSTPPTYSNLIENADPLELGDNVIITININDFAGINQSLIEFEGLNHSMTNIYGNVWQYNSWIPNKRIIYQYKIYMEDKSSNWNFTNGTLIVQDTTPPSSPIITNAPSGEVSGILTFDWMDGFDPSGILSYILIIDNESDSTITPGYVFEFNITNTGPESSYIELTEILSPGKFYYFLSQIDGIGQQSSFTTGSFTVIGRSDNNGLMMTIIISLIFASVIGSIATVIIVKRRFQKKILPHRKKIPIKMIISHINNILSSKLIFEREDSQKKKIRKNLDKKLHELELIDEKELENQLNEIKTLGEELLHEGAYLEAQKQFETAEKILLKLGRKNEALLFSDLTTGIKELSEEREKRLEILEHEKLEGNSMNIFNIFYDLIEISKNLRDQDAANMYLSELIQIFQADKLKLIDLRNQSLILEEQANSLKNSNLFEKAAKVYEKCEKISHFLVQLGSEEEKTSVEKFRNKKNECIENISS